MMTRKIIKKILPNALPLAVLLISVAMPHASFSADDTVLKKSTSKSSSSTKKSSKSSDVSTDKDTKDRDAAKDKESDTSSDGARVKELVYNESNVYVIRTKYGYQTNIVFDPKEEVQTISVGDRSLWQIIPAGNRLYIRPMTDNLSTNMTLITTKHTYEFDLKSVPEKNNSNVYVVRFTYPDKNPAMAGDILPYAAPATPAAVYVPVESSQTFTPAAAEAHKQVASEAASPASIGLLPIRYNYSYTYAGPDALAPLQVYDDGKTTFIKYKTIAKPVPDTFSIDASGKETHVPATVKGSSLIVDGVANELALRSGDGEIRVYNESSSPR